MDLVKNKVCKMKKILLSMVILITTFGGNQVNAMDDSSYSITTGDKKLLQISPMSEAINNVVFQFLPKDVNDDYEVAKFDGDFSKYCKNVVKYFVNVKFSDKKTMSFRESLDFWGNNILMHSGRFFGSYAGEFNFLSNIINQIEETHIEDENLNNKISSAIAIMNKNIDRSVMLKRMITVAENKSRMTCKKINAYGTLLGTLIAYGKLCKLLNNSISVFSKDASNFNIEDIFNKGSGMIVDSRLDMFKVINAADYEELAVLRRACVDNINAISLAEKDGKVSKDAFENLIGMIEEVILREFQLIYAAFKKEFSPDMFKCFILCLGFKFEDFTRDVQNMIKDMPDKYQSKEYKCEKIKLESGMKWHPYK